jgi:hypothetical protein
MVIPAHFSEKHHAPDVRLRESQLTPADSMAFFSMPDTILFQQYSPFINLIVI